MWLEWCEKNTAEGLWPSPQKRSPCLCCEKPLPRLSLCYCIDRYPMPLHTHCSFYYIDHHLTVLHLHCSCLHLSLPLVQVKSVSSSSHYGLTLQPKWRTGICESCISFLFFFCFFGGWHLEFLLKLTSDLSLVDCSNCTWTYRVGVHVAHLTLASESRYCHRLPFEQSQDLDESLKFISLNARTLASIPRSNP